jgi:uncharacterized Zn finger protein
MMIIVLTSFERLDSKGKKKFLECEKCGFVVKGSLITKEKITKNSKYPIKKIT